jgi:hypothetical protein
MNRANQQQLFQQANQQVLDIRQTEIDYYTTLNVVYGTNAALLGGFTYGILTQNVLSVSNPDENIFCFFYYLLSAGTIASSIHVVLCSMLIQVYGPGLSLHGPLGSMALAAQGMREETTQIFYYLLFSIFCFCTSLIWLFWAVMPEWKALCCSVGALIVFRYMWYYGERIFLRFYWKTESVGWNGDRTSESRFSSDDVNPADATLAAEGQQERHSGAQYRKKELPFPLSLKASSVSSLFGGKKKHSKGEVSWAEEAPAAMESGGGAAEEGGATNRDSLTSMNGPAPSVFGGGSQMGAAGTGNLNSNSNSNLSSSYTASSYGNTMLDPRRVGAGAGIGIGRTPSGRDTVAMEGYFTTMARKDLHILLESRMWERKYFVLLKTGEFYVYKTRQDFRQTPKEPIYSRPLRLVDFFVRVDNHDQDLRSECEDDAKSEVSAAVTARGTSRVMSRPLVFQITLDPRENEVLHMDRSQFRNHWLLRCDTEEELGIWVSLMQELCPSCFKDATHQN